MAVEQHWIQDVLAYTGLVLMIITVAIWCRGTYRLRQENKNTKKPVLLSSLSMASGLCYAIWLAVNDTIATKLHFQCAVTDACYKVTKYGILFIIYQRVFLYLFYLQRMHAVFRTTSFELSDKKYNYLRYSIHITFGILSLAFLIWCFYIDILTDIQSKDDSAYLTLLYPLVLVDLVCCITCMVMFIRRLKKLINNIQRNMSDGNNEQLMQESVRYEYTVKKLTLLSSVQVISTDLLFILINFVEVINNIIVMDVWLNTVCLMLTFKMYDKPYKSIFSCTLLQRNAEFDEVASTTKDQDVSTSPVAPSDARVENTVATRTAIAVPDDVEIVTVEDSQQQQ